MNRLPVLAGLGAVALAATGASGAVTITKGTSAPTYSTTLNFDEVGGPTGTAPSNSWVGIGVTELVGGAGPGFIAQVNTNPGFGWCGTGNVFYGAFGVFLTFAQDTTEFSARYWDSSGPATFMGGGALVVAFNNGVQVGELFVTNPAYGGVGEEYFNITTDGGSTFDEVRMLGFGFFPEAYVDDLSWNSIPSPGTGALFALAGVVALRRRR